MKKRTKTTHTETHDSPEPAEGQTQPPAPTEEQIRMRAHELYLARGGEPGHDWDDWLLAEHQLQTELGVRPPEPPAKSNAPTSREEGRP